MEQSVSQTNDGITINVELSVKNIYVKNIVWNPVTCNCESGKYLASIMDDSVITCYEVIELSDEEIKTCLTNFN